MRPNRFRHERITDSAQTESAGRRRPPHSVDAPTTTDSSPRYEQQTRWVIGWCLLDCENDRETGTPSRLMGKSSMTPL